jgi:8-oxo-dGTP diphosphatase
MGWSRFAELTHHSTLPIYAIGGMQASDLPVSFASGAHGVAMIRGAWANTESIA